MLTIGLMKLEEKHNMENYAVLLDTSFIIRLLSESDELHNNAVTYFKYFLEHGIDMKFSTISIAEYCVIGKGIEPGNGVSYMFLEEGSGVSDGK